MSKWDKILNRILSATSDHNIAFEDLCGLLNVLKFDLRTKGSHFLYFKKGIEEIINLQSKDGKAKSYQVKQVRNLILKYKLSIKDA